MRRELSRGTVPCRVPSTRELPDFIIGGAPRCGTTYLYRQMREHPEICMSASDEPTYFVKAPPPAGIRKILRVRTGGYYHRGWSWYEAQFAHCPPGRVLGEASVLYLHSPESAGLIKATAPNVRMIFQLRDPVDRIVSQYLRDLRRRRLPPLEEMVASGHERLRGWVSASSYSRHLERWYTTFPREQILVLFLEDLRRNALDNVSRVFEFIGVDPTFVPSRVAEPVNAARLSRSRLVAQVFGMRPLPYPKLQHRWDDLTTFVSRYNRKPADVHIDPAVRPQLWLLLREDFERLPEMIGGPVPIEAR
jgi:hypothetical protein